MRLRAAARQHTMAAASGDLFAELRAEISGAHAPVSPAGVHPAEPWQPLAPAHPHPQQAGQEDAAAGSDADDAPPPPKKRRVTASRAAAQKALLAAGEGHGAPARQPGPSHRPPRQRHSPAASSGGSGARSDPEPLARRLHRHSISRQEASALAQLPLPPCLERLLGLFTALNAYWHMLQRNQVQAKWTNVRQHLQEFYEVCCCFCTPAGGGGGKGAGEGLRVEGSGATRIAQRRQPAGRPLPSPACLLLGAYMRRPLITAARPCAHPGAGMPRTAGLLPGGCGAHGAAGAACSGAARRQPA